MLRIAQTLNGQLLAAMERAFPAAAEGARAAGQCLDPQLAPATKPEFGDFQANGALPLAKPLGQPPRKIAEAIVAELAADPEPKVRLQLAFSLGASTDPLAGATLGRLLANDATEPMILAAVLTSAVHHGAAVTASAAPAGRDVLGRAADALLPAALVAGEAVPADVVTDRSGVRAR